MFSTTDTIVAIATPPGRGGIGVVRLSGSDALRIGCEMCGCDALVPRHATLATISAAGREPIDRAIVTHFPALASYTGDSMVELSAHGSPVILRTIVAEAVSRGARLAEPGEFTLRAFLNGRMDLTQAEAVVDLIDAVTPLQARAAFDQLNGTLTSAIAAIDAQLFDLIARLEASVDFPEEGYHFVEPGELSQALDDLRGRTRELLRSARRGRILRDGFQVTIVGRPNAGKSSLFNALVGSARAIVTDVPGTTRDLVTETVDIDGLEVTFVDTAGIRPTNDLVESEGISRTHAASDVADLILVVRDLSSLAEGDQDSCLQSNENKRLIVGTKADLHRRWQLDGNGVEVSAMTGAGMDELRRRILEALDVEPLIDRPAITNVRHAALVERADAALGRARASALSEGFSLAEEFVLADLQDARSALEEVTGKRTSDDLLRHIFERFCIGK